jgi:hypothetical protein
VSLQNINLAMPDMDQFVGAENYVRMWEDRRFWGALAFTVIYTGVTVALQLVIGLGMALLILQIPRAQWAFRIVAIIPIVLAPVVAVLFWRTLMLTPDFGIVDFASRSLGLGSHNWLGDPQLARVSVIAIHTWQWTPFVFLYLLAALAALPADLYEAARIDRASAWRRFVHITRRHPAGDRHRGDPAHDGGALGLRGDLRRDRRRAGYRDRDHQPVRVPRVVCRAVARLRRLCGGGPAGPHHGGRGVLFH